MSDKKSPIHGELLSYGTRPSPKISVITVNLNDANGLERTLKSVRMQSYLNYEHILIDGASTDGSADVWQSIGSTDPRFTMVSERDDGIYHAMNKGVDLVTGDLVQVLNAGDTLTDQTVFQQVSDTWQVDSTWQWGFGRLCFRTKEGLPDNRQKTPPFNYSQLRWGHSYVPHPSSFVSASLFGEYGAFNPRFGIAADQEFFMRISKDNEPFQWDANFSNFFLGGAHSALGLWKRERMWHLMRSANNNLAWGSNVVDSAYTEVLALRRVMHAVSRRFSDRVN